jgi:hypothetical protein
VIDSFVPFRTPPGQTLLVKRIKLSKFEATNANAVFRVENPEAVLVEELGCDWAGGKLLTSSFRLDRKQAVLDAAISADKLELAKVLPLMTERVSGEGTLYGRLPVHLAWPKKVKGDTTTILWDQAELSFGEGFLYATPGGGRLRLADPRELIGPSLDQSAEWRKGGRLFGVRENLMSSLEDLDYSVLKISFTPFLDGFEEHLLAKVFIAGKGHKGPDAQEIGGFEVNVRGFDQLLKQAIGLSGKLSAGK